MIGYMLEQELGNVLPREVPLATILTMVQVDPNDPAFGNPTKFVGPIYDRAEADRLPPRRLGLQGRRRQLAAGGAVSGAQRIFEIRPIHWLLDQGVVLICAGGGGVPTMLDPATRTRSSGSRP